MVIYTPLNKLLLHSNNTLFPKVYLLQGNYTFKYGEILGKASLFIQQISYTVVIQIALHKMKLNSN